MAKKKGASSTTNGRDSRPKYLGIKVSDGSYIHSGGIVLTQRGSKYSPGKNSYMGKTFTIHSAKDGTIRFVRRRNRIFIDVE